MDDAVNPVASPQVVVVPAPMVKLVLEMSKKMFPTASIFILLLEPGVLGTGTISVPSFAVLDANTVEKLFPPSVDSKMLTNWQLMGAKSVPFTLHVTVAVPPAVQVTFVFGEVTAKGPPVFATVTTTSVKAVCPTAAGAAELNG